MKRMIWILLFMIGSLVMLSLLRPEWSFGENVWANVILVFFLLMLGIELGLYYWRSRAESLKWMIKHLPKDSRLIEDANYIPKNEDSNAS